MPSQERPSEEPGRGAFLTQSKPAMALDLRFADGRRKAFQYVTLNASEMDGERVTLFFEAAKVTITGRNLEAGYGAIHQCRCLVVQEQHASEFAVGGGEAWVERITVAPADPAGPGCMPGITDRL